MLRPKLWPSPIVWAFHLLFVLVGQPSVECSEPAILLGLSGQDVLNVRRGELSELALSKDTKGIVISAAPGQAEAIHWLERGELTRISSINGEGASEVLVMGARSRSPGNTPASPQEVQLLASTLRLPQLSATVVLRGDLFLTPMHQGSLLNPTPTFRRSPQSEGEKLVAAVADLFGPGNKRIATISFAAEESDVPFQRLENLHKDYQQGLLPGRYSLRMRVGTVENTFTVTGKDDRERMMAAINQLGDPAKTDDPAATQFAVERLLQERLRSGTPRYLTDALDLLEKWPEQSLTPYLRTLKDDLRDWLTNLAGDPGYRPPALAGIAPDTSTGIEELDIVRSEIAAGRWSEARARLANLVLPEAPHERQRAEGLRGLYESAILADAGLGQEDEAEQGFQRALDNLQAGGTDLLRAHNNFGNFYLQRSQEQIHNHTFQIASGIPQPLYRAVDYWLKAQENFSAAQKLPAGTISSVDRAAVQLNEARLYVLLADIIATLDPPRDGPRKFADGQKAAVQTAVELAGGVEAAEAALLTRGAAAELRAHLAFRDHQPDFARSHALIARDRYAKIGFLAGIESTERLLGLAYESSGQITEAVAHLKKSQALAELLRARFPADEIGMTRAGFFSRRSFVFERLVALHIQLGEPLKALEFAELAKARATQDLLTAASLNEADQQPTSDLPALLAAWPREVAAIEYFIGVDHAWVILISVEGNVTAHALVDSHGRALSSSELLARVRVFLTKTEKQATKITQRILRDDGFDHSWQDELHEFYHQLIPKPVAEELRQAKTVVVVPHHILHYFPFAALVVEPDNETRASDEMVSPKRFLIDEPYNLLYSPSLSIWHLLRQRPQRPLAAASAIGLVDVPGAAPLPGVESDLQNFRAIFGKRTRAIYENRDANEQNALRLLAEPGVALLASHGVNHADRPLESHLMLAAPPAAEPTADDSLELRDGRLTARELYGTKIRSSLIVLSACYSGLGDRSPPSSDDVFGIQRACLQAGAGTVVSGQWDVFDGTAPDLIKVFFERVAQGEPASAALAESQRSFLRQLRDSGETAEPYFHPYFWAVYTVCGDDGASKPNAKAPYR